MSQRTPNQATPTYARPRTLVGTSGWRYRSWRGDFYPTGLVQRRELEYISRRLATVEINGSFYSLQRPSSYRRWRQETPDGFVFGVKGGRYVTHMLRMRGVESALANFFASGVLLLEEKLGPVLWQLPERVTFDAREVDEFCAQLPMTLGDAVALASRHTDKVAEFEPPAPAPAGRRILHALEPRHPSFDSDECAAILARHNVALVTADSAGRWPMMTRVTADFVYVRLHGSPDLYASGYGTERLAGWAGVLREWTEGTRDAYVYFDNDARGFAPYDAETMAALCALPPAE
jgi:uncharacterized protein YecE (DUF72 family)